MSLSKQLITLIVTLLVLVFAGTIAINLHNTQAYLNQQMESHAQDTATSLGLSLKPILESNDTALLNATVDAINDRGYYRHIILTSTSGETMLERKNEIQFRDVPEWFIDLFPLSTPEAHSTITSGWKQVATLRVSSHPGYAYNELWKIAKHNLLWLLGLAIAASLITVLIVRFILKPLHAVEQQAKAISDREFPIQKKLPRTPELRRVTKAMNHMSAKVAQMIATQTEITENMRARASEDPVTRLQNRRSLEERLEHVLKTPEEYQTGSLMLLRLWKLAEINNNYGYLKGDELLKETAEILCFSCDPYKNAVVSRIGGSEFAILMPNISLEETKSLANEICQRLGRLHIKGLIEDCASINMGISYFSHKQSMPELLASTDSALRMAQTRGPNQWYLHEPEAVTRNIALGAGEWKKILERAIDTESLILYQQPVYSVSDESIMHHEILVRIQDEKGNIIPAAVFMPVAERYELAHAIDKLVIAKTAQLLHQGTQQPYAVNVAMGSLLSHEFMHWLTEFLSQHHELATHLIFETTENSLPQDISNLKESITRLRSLGSQVSLDHFGTGSPSFGYLRNLKLGYIKIDGSYIHNIESNMDNQFFLSSLAEIAHGLDIQVIAEYVETETEREILRGLHFDGVQGYLTGAPEPASLS